MLDFLCENDAVTFGVIASGSCTIIQNKSGRYGKEGEADEKRESKVRYRDHVLRRWRWRIRRQSVRFAEQH